MNREQWLTTAVKELRPVFKKAGVPLPKNVRVSCGFPGGGSARKRIGECWSPQTAGGVNQIFINPTLSKPADVLATLTHELAHASDDCASGHGATFGKAARRLGLAGKLTATHAGPELAATLKDVAKGLGKYPHKGMTLSDKDRKKQSTRMLKLECPKCGYTVRTTRKWLEVGLPECPCGKRMVAS